MNNMNLKKNLKFTKNYYHIRSIYKTGGNILS